MRKNLGGRCVVIQLRAKSAAGVGIGEDQHADVVAVVAGDDYVAHEWREVAEDARTQRANAGPCAAGEFEILGKAAVEEETFVDVRGIHKAQSVAEIVEA